MAARSPGATLILSLVRRQWKGVTAGVLVGLAWTLALIVAALAGLAAVTGICVGCEMYLWLARLRGRPLAPVGSA